MIRYLIIFIISITLLSASSKNLDKKIAQNQESLKKNRNTQFRTDLQIKVLAKQISNQNKELSKLEKVISLVNKDIQQHKDQLDKANKQLNELHENSKSLRKRIEDNEKQMINVIIDDFSSSIALKLAGESTTQELIDSQIYSILSQDSKDQILKLNNSYELVTQNKKENQQKIKKISSYIANREKKKKELYILKKKYSNSLVSLEKKHKEYQKELKASIQKQESLKNLLGRLNILKKEELNKEKKERIAKAKRLAAQKKSKTKTTKKSNSKDNYILDDDARNSRYAKDIDLDVRMIGSSTSGVKIVKYKGRKTIAPLDSFKVVKKFGKYYDPVYKIQLFNESIVLKTNKPQAKVKAIFNGKIVYAKKDAGMLENVVIVQHQNGLHTIYSHLDKISPSLKVGRWIKKGYVVGRVNDTLTFQATKNEKHVDPKDLFKI